VKVFYSWQSDTPKLSRYLRKAIDKAISGIDEVTLYRPDRKTARNIDDRILQGIDDSDFFIADISIVGGYEREDLEGKIVKKLTANPNVLYESGYAIKRFERQRVLLIAARETTTETGSLPFDLRNRDILIRSFSEKNIDTLASEIKGILLESDSPLEVDQPYILCENAGSSMSSDQITMINYNFKNSEGINYFLEYIELGGVKSEVNRDLPANQETKVVANGLPMSPYDEPFESVSFVVSRGKAAYRITQKLKLGNRADEKFNLDGIIQKPVIVKL
jgi:hypothetical protein